MMEVFRRPDHCRLGIAVRHAAQPGGSKLLAGLIQAVIDPRSLIRDRIPAEDCIARPGSRGTNQNEKQAG
jgi:hypothetical protein